jgi:uncharacterized protein (TIGR02246 family)
MRKDRCSLPLFLVLVFSVPALFCGAPEPEPKESARVDTATDEAAVRAHAARFEAALNDRDFAAFAALFVPDGDFVLVNRPRASGQDAILRTIEAAWTNAPPARRATITVEQVRFPAPDVAVVDAVARFTEGEPTQDRATSVLVRRDGAWRNLILRVLPAATE